MSVVSHVSLFMFCKFNVFNPKIQTSKNSTPHPPPTPLHLDQTWSWSWSQFLSRTDLCSVSYHCLCRPLLGEFFFSAEPTKRMQVFTIKSIFLFFLFCNNNNENFFFSERSSDMFMELFGETSSQSPMARVTVSLNIMK